MILACHNLKNHSETESLSIPDLFIEEREKQLLSG